MTLSPELAALRDEAMQTSCISWAIQKRWALAKMGIDRAGPCPACGGTDRFSIHTVKNTFNCRKCGISGVGVIDLVMKTDRPGAELGFIEACEIVSGRKASAPIDVERAAKNRRRAEREKASAADQAARYREHSRKEGHRAWVSSWRPQPDGFVYGYLKVRGIDLAAASPEIVEAVLARLHEHDALEWVEPYEHPETGRTAYRTLHIGPALVAAVQLSDDRFGAVHQTWIDLMQPKGRLVLAPDAKGDPRPSKKVRGVKRGGAIRIFTPGIGQGSGQGQPWARRLVVGEGIETTLTPLIHALEPETAYWAGVDLGNMAGKAARDAEGRIADHGAPDLEDIDCFIPPDWCEELIYLTEDDGPRSHSIEKAWRGLRRAEALREKARATNPALPTLSVSYVPPVEGGGDLNDLVRDGAP